jgi:hypothetical protein
MCDLFVVHAGCMREGRGVGGGADGSGGRT